MRGWTRLVLAVAALLVIAVALSHAAPVYDCAFDPDRLPVCEWTTDDLHSQLSRLIASEYAHTLPSSLPALLRDEEVDGNVYLSLEPSEIDMLLDQADAQRADREASREAVVATMQRFMAQTAPSAAAETPTATAATEEADASPAEAASTCGPLLDKLPVHERSLLSTLRTEVDSIRQQPASLFPTSAAVSPYSGRWPHSAYQRLFSRLLHSPAPPRVIVLYGEYEVDVAFALSAYQPHALVVQLADRRPSDSAAAVADKLAKRQAGTKRGKASVVNLKLPVREAACLLIEAGIQPDLLIVSPHLFPIDASCCRWWQRSVVVGYQPDYRHLHPFALLTGHRVYNDQPLYVLSTPLSPVRCVDWLGDAIRAEQPLLGLYMMVKDEAGGIADTMHSALPHLDGISVLDTGSEDDTVQRIESLMSEYGVSGAVHHGSFVDFSTTRNEALRLAAATLNTTFLLMLNGDDTLLGGEQLRRFLSYRAHMCGASDEMYLASVDYEGHKLAWSERVMRTSNHVHADWPSARWWRYIGLTHEHYTHERYASGADGDYSMTYAGRRMQQSDDGMHWHVYHTYVRDDKDKLKRRAAKDAELLLQQLQELPDDPRTLYYLSHSYDIREEYAEAYKWHKRRVDRVVAQYRAYAASPNTQPLPAADKEECTCLLRLGKIAAFRLEAAHGWAEGEEWLELTRALCREQIEARYYLAEHYAVQADYDRAWLYAREAEALQQSGEGLVHVLESELIRDRLPHLVRVIKENREGTQEAKGKPKSKPKGKTKKKRSSATSKKRDEL